MGAADMDDEIMDVEAEAAEIDGSEAFLLARFLKAAAKELAELELEAAAEAVLMVVLVTMAETTAGVGTTAEAVCALAENEMLSRFFRLIQFFYCCDPFLSSGSSVAEVVALRRPRTELSSVER